MQFMQENIEFSEDVPIIVGIKNLTNIPRHWSNRIEIFLVLSGSFSIEIETETYHLSEDDIILVNSNQVYEIQCKDNVVVVLQINYSYFKKWLDEPSFFHCNSTIHHNKSRFIELKRIIAQLIYINYNETESNGLQVISLAYQLILELVKNYKSYDRNPMNQNSKHLLRLREIIQYLNENYADNITLVQIADKEFLSHSYLSHFFKVNMGVSFFNYLTGIRLNHAVNDLLTTTLTMEQIAANNGFANCRYFVNCFKKKFHVLPKQYRKEQKKEALNKNASNSLYKGFLLMEQVDYLNKLGEYLDTERITKTTNIVCSSPCNTIEVNAMCYRKNLVHTYKTFIGVGRAKEILMERVQNELKTLQREVGFRYIKFHGLLDDSMMIYNEDSNGNPFLTYSYVDDMIDFLLSINLKPLIQLSFMPKQLAKDPSRTIFYNPVILSEPKDNSKWAYMITELTKHFINRYGLEEVRSWLFSFWNVPFQSYIFSFDTDDIAYELYRITWTCVKNCDSLLRFGSPSYGSLSFSCPEYYDFLNYCRDNNCYPDFYNIHCYPVKTSTNKEFAPSGEISEEYSQNDKIILSEDSDYMAHTIECFKSNLTSYPKLPIYITEWASTSSHRDWLNDTCYRSAYMAKNILDNYDAVGSFGSWCLTDTLEELPLDNEIFHGELGLITYNGIKKPAYYTYSFLCKLMDTLIDRGNGYFITTNQKGDYAILLYNYIPILPLYAQGILFNVTFLERYKAFDNPSSHEFDFALSRVADGKYIMTEYIVNRDHGSAFDEWVRMGALPLTTEEEVTTLKGHSLPKITKSKIEVTNNSLNYFAELKPHEIRLVLINKCKFDALPYTN